MPRAQRRSLEEVEQLEDELGYQSDQWEEERQEFEEQRQELEITRQELEVTRQKLRAERSKHSHLVDEATATLQKVAPDMVDDKLKTMPDRLREELQNVGGCYNVFALWAQKPAQS